MTEHNSHFWRSAYDILDRALDLLPDEREAFVRKESANDPALLPIVVDLLEEVSDENAALEQEELTAGKRIGRYEITGKLGSGGMGRVYSARDSELGRVVALKFLTAGSAAAGSPTERLVREAKAASALNHPHIVTVYDVVRCDQGFALVMELVEGKSLRDHCGASLPVERVIRWGRQIAEALAATHSLGIVHRDIKPENIMVRPDGHCKVVDFGLARRTVLGGDAGSASSRSGQFLGAGTLNYMSPEQMLGKSPTSASDVFSLGAILYELLCGCHPFLMPSRIDTAHAILHSEPLKLETLGPDIPHQLTRLVLAMLDKDPALRPTALELDQRLAAVNATSLGAVRAARDRFPVWTIALIMGLAGVLAAGLSWPRALGRTLSRPAALVLIPLPHMPEERVMAAAVSPQGTMLAYVPGNGPLAVRSLGNGETLHPPSPEALRASRIAWFADQKHLLVSGSLNTGNPPAIWIIPIEDLNEAPLLVSRGRDAVPSPDGTRIALASPDGGLIWVINRDGSGQRTVRAGGGNTNYSSLVWSPDGKRVSYMVLQQPALSASAETLQTFQSADVESGRVVANVEHLGMFSGTALPDGRILCLPWAYPSTSHGGELLEIRTHPETGVFLGQSARPMPYAADGLYSSFSASNDGLVMALVAATASVNLYSAEVRRPAASAMSLTNIQRLTSGEAEDYPHAWTTDSRAVFFESDRNGKHGLFRIDFDRRIPEAVYVSFDLVAFPHTTPDGKWILFRRKAENRNAELMRLPAGGGTPDVIMVSGKNAEEFRCGLGSGSRCVVRSTEADQFVFRELDPVRGPGRVLARTTLSPLLFFDWDLSPDGKTVAIPNHDSRTAQIRLVAMDAEAGADERIIRIDERRNLSSVAWSADGQGLFVSAITASGGVLLYSDLMGNTQELLESGHAIFVVPSPDGKKIVFPKWTGLSEVQMLKAP